MRSAGIASTLTTLTNTSQPSCTTSPLSASTPTSTARRAGDSPLPQPFDGFSTRSDRRQRDRRRRHRKRNQRRATKSYRLLQLEETKTSMNATATYNASSITVLEGLDP